MLLSKSLAPQQAASARALGPARPLRNNHRRPVATPKALPAININFVPEVASSNGNGKLPTISNGVSLETQPSTTMMAPQPTSVDGTQAQLRHLTQQVEAQMNLLLQQSKLLAGQGGQVRG